MPRNCIDASCEKGRVPDAMAGAERRIPEKKREAGRWMSGTAATGACERPASLMAPRAELAAEVADSPSARSPVP